MDSDTIDAVANRRLTDKLTDTEKLVAEYAEALTATPAAVDDDLAAVSPPRSPESRRSS